MSSHTNLEWLAKEIHTEDYTKQTYRVNGEREGLWWKCIITYWPTRQVFFGEAETILDAERKAAGELREFFDAI